VSKARSTVLTAQPPNSNSPAPRPAPQSISKKTVAKSAAKSASANIPQASQLPELADTPRAETAPLAPAPASKSARPAPIAPDKIPAPVAAEVRRLAHDLSNALEIIIQASYLLQMTNPEAQAKRWATMVDQGAQQAATINRKLREYIRNQMAD
jgi:hypothetical protein